MLDHSTSPSPILRLFGPPRLELNGRLVDLRLRHGLAILAWLGEHGRPCPRDRLAGLVWPDHDEASALARLRRTLHAVNERAGTPLVVRTGSMLSLAAAVGVDVVRFRHLAAAGSLDALAEAAEIATDDFLDGFSLEPSGEFQAWMLARREGLRLELDALLDSLAGLWERRGDALHAILCHRRRLLLDPLREPVHRALMQLLARTGQPAAALRQYEELVRLLDEELGVDPAPETVIVYRSLADTTKVDSGMPRTVTKPTLAHPMLPSPIRYASHDGMSLAWRELGAGPVDLVIVPGFVSHLEHGLCEPGLMSILQRLGRSARLILFDRRGLGLSERLGSGPAPELTQQDIATVMDAAGCRRAVLAGFSEGGPAVALFAARHPDRVRGLVLYGTLAKGCRAPDYPHAMSAPMFQHWLNNLVTSWGSSSGLEVFAPSRMADPDLRDWYAALLRQATTPAGLEAVLGAFRDTDVRSVLPDIQVPTLILHRIGDRAVRIEAGRDLARRITGARLIELDGDDHWWFTGNTDAVAGAIEDFLHAVLNPGPPHRPVVLRLLVILAVNLPDDLRNEIRGCVMGAGGRLLASPGPGVLLAGFDAVGVADSTARRIAQMFGGTRVRCGLAVGDCQEQQGTVSGPPVRDALALAEGTEIGMVARSAAVGALLTR